VNPLRQWVVDQYTQVTGRHDDPALYAAPAGDPGLVGPGSVSWEIHGDPASVRAGDIRVTAAELDDYVEAMRPQLAVNDQTREFFEFLLTPPFGPPLPSPVARPARAYQLHAAMSAMPRWARRLTGFEHSRLAQRFFFESQPQVSARSLRPLFGVPPYKAMAEARVAAARARAEAVPA